MMKASGRAAFRFFLAGLFVLFGAAAQAAPIQPQAANRTARANRPNGQAEQAAAPCFAPPRRGKTAQKSDDKADKKDGGKADEAKAENDVPASSQMPPAVANANAQLAAADTPTAAAASAMTGRANDNVQAAADNTAAPNAESQVVAPDQLNDIDRALQQDNPPAQKAVIAATDAQPRPAPVMASSQQSSAWDQSSLIGKIFIGVGTLLTLASAARMFMA